MQSQIKLRVLEIAKHILVTHDTLRRTASIFMVSKSTVHNDVSKRLKLLNNNLYKKVKKILDNNFSEKHIRGGSSTKRLYENNKNKQQK